MNNIFISFIFLLLLLALIVAGYWLVPGVEKSNEFSVEFVFSGYMALLTFLATAAVIGPLTSQFAKSRLDKEWRDARVNACKRLSEAISDVFSAYVIFINNSSDDRHNIASMHFDLTLKKIEVFMGIHEDEHITFNPAMHSALSNIRSELKELQSSLNTTKVFAHAEASVRLQFSRYDLDKIRALFELPRLKHPDSKTPLESHTYMNQDEPIVIEEDPFFFEHDRLFIDASIKPDRGTHSISKFHGINIAKIKDDWDKFLKACPKKHGVVDKISGIENIPIEKQISSHTDYLKKHISEDYMLEYLIKSPNKSN